MSRYTRSIFWVWISGCSGSKKFSLWFTQKCTYPSSLSEPYADQLSLIIVDPGWMYCLIKGTSVPLSLLKFLPSESSNKGTTNFDFDWRSIPPNNHVWASCLPQLYFRRTISVSSVSTISSLPPIGYWFSNQNSDTLQQKLRQSTLVWNVICKFLNTVSWTKCFETQ